MITNADDITRPQTRNDYLEELFQRNYVPLRRTAYVLVLDREAAEDLTMETFVRALPHWKRIRGMDWPAGYLRKTLVNLARSRARRAKTEAIATRLFAQPDRLDASREGGAEFRELVAALPFNQRACVTLKYLEGFTEAEIADVLERPLGTIKSQLARARERLAATHEADERVEGKDYANGR